MPRWTPERVALLTELYRVRRLPRTDVAAALGISTSALDTQIKRNGMTLRPPPPQTTATLCDPAAMARGCRKLASDLRREAARGWGAVPLTDHTRITRTQAAVSLDAQAERWEREAATGELNLYDRRRCGF